MKKAILITTTVFAYCLLQTAYCFSQGTAINTTGTAADNSAVFDVSSTTKGQLMPRMTTAQRNAIVSPAEGLQLFNTTTKCFEAFVNGGWYNVSCPATCNSPGAADTISGSDTVCKGQTGVAFSVGAIAYATGYSWTYSGTGFSIASGNGTNSITADFSSGATAGNLSVFGTNSCGNGSISPAYAITMTSPVSDPTAGTHSPSQNAIIWKWNTVSGATVYYYNTVNDFISATNNGADTSYNQTGLNCNTAYTLYVWAYNSCGNSAPAALTETTTTCSFSCGGVLSINHVAGSVAPETKSVDYGTVSLSLTGSTKCWITRNLGASGEASSAEDATEAAAGWVWQFNKKQGYANPGPNGNTNTTPTWTITSINENSDWTAANDPCTIELGSGWRIPTHSEWSNVWTNMGGGSTTIYTYYASSGLKLHLAGVLDKANGACAVRGGSDGNAHLWTSTQSDNYNGERIYVYPWNSGAHVPENKAYGMSVRCLKD